MGAKLGANGASHPATPGHTEPESLQVNSQQGDVWHRQAMGQACMACKRSGVRISLAPRVRSIIRKCEHHLQAKYSSEIQQRSCTEMPHTSADRAPSPTENCWQGSPWPEPWLACGAVTRKHGFSACFMTLAPLTVRSPAGVTDGVVCGMTLGAQATGHPQPCLGHRVGLPAPWVRMSAGRLSRWRRAGFAPGAVSSVSRRECWRQGAIRRRLRRAGAAPARIRRTGSAPVWLGPDLGNRPTGAGSRQIALVTDSEDNDRATDPRRHRSSDTRVIISAYRTGKSAMITRVSSVT